MNKNIKMKIGLIVFLLGAVGLGTTFFTVRNEYRKIEKEVEKEMGLDIGPKTIKLYTALLEKAATVFWNGPMGVFEDPAFSEGTFAVAKVMAQSKGTTIVGGGDSAAAAEASGFADQMTHISTGGGASLEYLQGEKLPGLEILRPRKQSEKMP